MQWLGVIGIALGLAALALLCIKGVNVYVASICAAVIVALCSGSNIYSTLMTIYARGFSDFLGNYLFLFLLGTIFGKLMEASGAAKGVADTIIRLVGAKNALIALPLAVGCLAYGGINGYVSIFASLPIMTQVFREANLPRRFMPAIFLFGAGTFANAGPGSPQILNVICTQAVGMDLMAGALPGFVGCCVILVVGILWLKKMVNTAVKNGEGFVSRREDSDLTREKLPSPVQSFLPLILVLVSINLSVDGKTLFPIEVAMLIGCLSVLVCCFNTIAWEKLTPLLGEGCQSAFMMVGSVCAMVGFGNVVSHSPAYETIIDLAVGIQAPPLVKVAVAMNIMCAITATASGASGIIAPVLGPLFVSMGVDAGAVARVMAVSATGFDSVPHNGTIVAIIHDICHETHQTAYVPVFNLCVVTPLIGTAATILTCWLMGI